MSLLTRNRILLVASLALFGLAVGVTVSLLRPEGLVRARPPSFGPRGDAGGSAVVGYHADREGGECGIAVAGQERPLPGCYAYQAPEVVEVGGRTLVVWEHADDYVAVSALGDDLALQQTVRFPRPRTERGVLLPRTSVGVAADQLAIRYLRDQVITVGAGLTPWPGGLFEVASARIGPRGAVVGGGLLGLLALYFSVAGWTLLLPRQLARSARAGRCVTVRMPERGATAVIEGRAVELDLERAITFGPSELGGLDVTLVLDADEHPGAGDAYRTCDRLRPRAVWAGTLDEALARARGMRAGSVAAGVAMAALLLLALDAYLVW